MDPLTKAQNTLKALIDEADALQKKGSGRSPDETTRLKALAVGDGSLINGSLAEIARFKTEAEEADKSLKAISDARQFLTSPAPTAINAPATSSPSALKAWAEPKPEPPKTLGEFITRSDQFQKALSDGSLGTGNHRFTFSGPETDRYLKAVMTTAAGWVPPTVRVDRDTDIKLRNPVLKDLIRVTTNAPRIIEWMQQTTRTNAAASRAEGATTAQGTRVWTPQVTTCQAVAVYQPVTKEQVKNVTQVQSTIDNQLMQEVDVVVEDLLMNGNGTSPNIRGFLNVSGILLQTMGADPMAEAIRKAITKVETTSFVSPTAIVMHPNDVEEMELKKDSTGQYLLGHPLLSVSRNWRVPIVPCLSIAENTALVGDFRGSSERWVNSELAVEIGWVNDDFIKNLLCVRAEVIQTLTVYRPNAFCKVDLTPP